MEFDDIIEVDFYEEGKWVTRQLPFEVAERLFQQLAVALGAHERPQQEAEQAGRLKLHVD